MTRLTPPVQNCVLLPKIISLSYYSITVPTVAGNTRQFGPEGDLVLVLQDPTDGDEVAHRFQVSSKHLKLASSVFKAMLSRNFREGIILQNASTGEIELHDDNPEALTILLSIIHHQARDVTVSPGLLLLANIAI